MPKSLICWIPFLRKIPKHLLTMTVDLAELAVLMSDQ